MVSNFGSVYKLQLQWNKIRIKDLILYQKLEIVNKDNYCEYRYDGGCIRAQTMSSITILFFSVLTTFHLQIFLISF